MSERRKCCLMIRRAKFTVCAAAALCVTLFSCVSGSSRPVSVSEKNILAEYYQIAEEYSKQSNHKKAVEYYLKSALYPGFNEEIMYKLARSYALSSDWDNALVYYNQLIEKDRENASLLMSAAYVYAKKEQYSTAIDIYKKLIEKRYYEPSYIKNLILLCAVSGSKEEAENYTVMFIEKFPDDTTIEAVKKERDTILEKTIKKESKPDADSSADQVKPAETATDQVKPASPAKPASNQTVSPAIN